MKSPRLVSLVLTLVAILGSTTVLAQSQPVPLPAPPQLASDSYVLMDYHSGRVIVDENSDKRHEPASLTKLMTAYVVFAELKAGHISLDDKVRVSEKAWRAPGSRMFIEVGDKIPLEDLIKGMIIQSGNDASIALAQHVAGDENTFAQVMNQYARQLGMKNTHYMNATGLPHEKHYSTAHDTAILARALIRDFPEYYDYYSQKVFKYNDIEQYNRNKLLWRDPSVDGLKTGHTDTAGYCLTASAERDGMRLISVVMGADSENARADQSQALLNYGFRFYETHRLYKAGETLTKARVWKGAEDVAPLGLARDLWVTIPQRQYDSLEASMSVDNMIMAPVTDGGKYGTVTVKLKSGTVAEAPLVALQGVPTGSLWQRMVDEVLLMFQ
ncbi:MAG: D-alanyl-D-alanine carboxypeptidase family protein [Ectothiorhodospiraceae bacterium]|jgi:D-alanyl-D-alanine carboxypeptidase (penicillin-binding protein 5/6)